MNAFADIQVPLADYNHASCMIYGIGNVGRQDDGLGWAFIDWLEETGICARAEITRHYQLHLEDADLISKKERVLFVDATKVPEVDDIRLETVTPSLDFSFTSHALSIPTIMSTCQLCFDRVPDVQLLTIRGYEWELKVGLTPMAARNLKTANAYFSKGGLLHDTEPRKPN